MPKAWKMRTEMLQSLFGANETLNIQKDKSKQASKYLMKKAAKSLETIDEKVSFYREL